MFFQLFECLQCFQVVFSCIRDYNIHHGLQVYCEKLWEYPCRYKHASFTETVIQFFELWVKAVGREDIIIEKRGSYRVCDKHFSNEMKFAAHNNRTNLKMDAIPTLYLSSM